MCDVVPPPPPKAGLALLLSPLKFTSRLLFPSPSQQASSTPSQRHRSEVLIDDFWGLWQWSSVMTSASSTVRLSFDYDWCQRSDTVEQCHLLLAARGLAIATIVLEAAAVISALVVECRTARRGGFSAEYACVTLSTFHLVCAILMLVVWSSVQDELRAQDLTSGRSKIHFGFSWWFFLVSAASTVLTDFCVIKELAHKSAYRTISPPGKTDLRSRNAR